MFWLALVTLMMFQCAVVLEWRRIRELVPAAMVGSVGSGLYLVVGLDNVPSIITDTGPLSGQIPNLMLLQIVIAPLNAMWYAQGLTPGARLPVVRTLLFTGIGLSMEWLGTAAGRVVHAPHWHPVYSLLYDLGFFLMVWRIHTWLTTPAREAKPVVYPES